MSRARDLAALVDANGDIVADALDNVPAPSGIIQVQYTQLSTASTQTWLANTPTAFTDLTVNITPT